MKVEEFWWSGFRHLALMEYNQQENQYLNKDLFERLNKLDFDSEGTIDDLEEFLENKANRSQLSERLNFILEKAEKIKDGNFSTSDIKQLKKKIKDEPANKLYPLLWAMQQNNMIKKEEFFFSDIMNFLDELVTKYGYLVELDDFFKTLSFFKGSFSIENPTHEKHLLLSLPVIQRAVEAFPEKMVFKAFRAKLLYINGEYEKCLALANSINKFIQDNFENIADIKFDEFDELDYLGLMHINAMSYYELNDFDKVISLENFVISNYAAINNRIFSMDIFEPDLADADKIELKDEKEEEDDWVIEALDAYFYRMRANMMKNNKEAVMNDYKKILKEIVEDNQKAENDLEMLKIVYPDVFKYIDENFPD